MAYNFIHIPKCAGSSIFQIIDVNNTIGYCGHTRIVDIPTIAITRHPYDRLISAYFYIIDGGGHVEPDLTYCEMLKKYSSFKDFVMFIEQDNLFEIIHLRPMAYFLCNDEGDLIVTKTFKMEEINKIDNFLVSEGLQKLSEVHTNISNHSHYTDYLDKEIIAEVNRLYEKDFILFNYRML